MKYPRAIQSLIEKLSELPSVGPKTAERYVFHLLKQPTEKLKNLSLAIGELQEKTVLCRHCRVISETDPCAICSDANRQAEVLCVVENTQDLLAIEATKQFNGRYFVLGGLINTISDVKPEDLNISLLTKRVKTDKINELILGLNFTLEGETTALYLNKIFKDHLKITRLAKGLPAGSALEYADELTLGSALRNRNSV